MDRRAAGPRRCPPSGARGGRSGARGLRRIEPRGRSDRRRARAGRRLRARRDRSVARRAPRRSRRLRPPLGVAPPAADPRLEPPRPHPPPRARHAPRALRGPERRPPRAGLVRPHRPPDGGARGGAGDRLLPLLPRARQGLVLEGDARPEGRPRQLQEEPARDRAPGLPAGGEDQRDARPPARRRPARRARARVRRQPDVPRHRPPHLQRLHEGVRLPEAGAGEHPADRDAGPHRGALPPGVGDRDPRLPDALEPAQRPPPLRSPLQRQERRGRRARAGGLHARAPPRLRRLRRRRGGRPESRAARRAPHRPRRQASDADPRLQHPLRRARRAHPPRVRRRVRVRNHGALGQELPDARVPLPLAPQEPPDLRRHSLRWDVHARRRLGARLRPRRDRGGGRASDDHRHQEQPLARDPKGERLPHGAPADGCLQEELDREPAGDAPGGRDRRRAHRDRHRHGAPRLLRRPDRKDAGALRDVRARKGGGRDPGDVRRRGVGDARGAARPRPGARRRARDGRARESRAAGAGAPPQVGRGHARLPEGARRLAGVPPEPRRGRKEPRGRGALRRAPLADGGDPRRAGAREGGPVRAQGRELRRSTGADGLRRGGDEPERDLREGAPRDVPARREGAVLQGAQGGRRLRRPGLARACERRGGGLLHELLERRSLRLVLRRQSPVLRRERRPGDGEREGRLPAGGGALSGRRVAGARRGGAGGA